MNLKYHLLLLLTFVICFSVSGQTNQTDASGRKQGHWIKKYPNGNTHYDGYFKDDKPVGEFKRYYENNVLKSDLTFSENSTEATATLYHPNGLIASKGKYNNQLKDGKWQYFSSLTDGCIIGEETFIKDKRNGFSLKFYSDSTIAEKVNYINNIRNGEWTKYHPNGQLNFKTNYTNGKLNGKFEAFFDDGKQEVQGQYKDDFRDGLWIIYNKAGKKRFQIEYTLGIANNRDIDIYESNYIDSLERNRVKIADPEKTGEIW